MSMLGRRSLSHRMEKLTGRALYKAIGQPKTVVAPMVDQSELAWRVLSRRYGADLCYTPMFHARLFANEEKYRQSMWCKELDGQKGDRPLVVQFCGNDPDTLLKAAQFVENDCDAVDLNLGCPQGIARKGKYGAFLMEDWDLIYKLINILHVNLKVPVTAKIRIYDDWEKSLAYAKMVLSAGAQWITIHGRTRDMKGQATGLANWKILKYLRDNLPEDQVFFANGNILYPEDLKRCTDEVGCDAVMSAEGNLYNPGVFWTDNNDIDKTNPRVDKLLREYFDIIKEVVPVGSQASRHAMKAHVFKVLHAFLAQNTDLRPMIGQTSVHADLSEWEKIVTEVEIRVAKALETEDDVITEGSLESWGGRYKAVPWWRAQPYFRTVNGEKQNLRQLKVAASGDDAKQITKDEGDAKRKAEDEGETRPSKKAKEELAEKDVNVNA